MIRWPWTKHEPSDYEMEQARKALAEAQRWQARSRRVAVATERAIVQNHFAADLRKAMEGDK